MRITIECTAKSCLVAEANQCRCRIQTEDSLFSDTAELDKPLGMRCIHNTEEWIKFKSIDANIRQSEKQSICPSPLKLPQNRRLESYFYREGVCSEGQMRIIHIRHSCISGESNVGGCWDLSKEGWIVAGCMMNSGADMYRAFVLELKETAKGYYRRWLHNGILDWNEVYEIGWVCQENIAEIIKWQRVINGKSPQELNTLLLQDACPEEKKISRRIVRRSQSK